MTMTELQIKQLADHNGGNAIAPITVPEAILFNDGTSLDSLIGHLQLNTSTNVLDIDGNASTASNISSKLPILAVATEHNEIKVIDLGNTVPASGMAQRHAIDFQWYDSHWAIGNLRSGSTLSSGFGISYSADAGSSWSNKFYVYDKGVDLSSFKVNIGTGIDANTCSQGLYISAGTITNCPMTNHGVLLYCSSVGTPFQYFFPDNQPFCYKRWKNTSTGAWYGWYKSGTYTAV